MVGIKSSRKFKHA